MKIYEVLGKINQLVDDEMAIDSKSISELDLFFELLKTNIEPEIKYDNNHWTFYVTEEKGSLEEYKQYIDKDYYDENDVAYLLEEFEYYKEKEWIKISTVETDNGYRIIQFNNRNYITVSPKNDKQSFKYDISELLEWLISKIKTVIYDLKNNLYNEQITKELPNKFKTGTIRRRDLWKLSPEIKENYLELISQERIKEFIEYVNNSKEEPEQRLMTMTVNDFLKYCSYCYRSNKMEGYETMSDYELFCRHSCSHGHHDGFDEVDWDSVSDFDKVCSLIDNHSSLDYDFGGHAWAIVDGSSRSRIQLHPVKDDKGYYLSLAGGDKYSTVEVANTFIELKRNKIPVKLWDKEIMVRKLTGDDLIGIVPDGIFPAYCSEYFPEDEVVSFCDYWSIDDIKDIENYINWHQMNSLNLLHSDD